MGIITKFKENLENLANANPGALSQAEWEILGILSPEYAARAEPQNEEDSMNDVLPTTEPKQTRTFLPQSRACYNTTEDKIVFNNYTMDISNKSNDTLLSLYTYKSFYSSTHYTTLDSGLTGAAIGVVLGVAVRFVLTTASLPPLIIGFTALGVAVGIATMAYNDDTEIDINNRVIFGSGAFGIVVLASLKAENSAGEKLPLIALLYDYLYDGPYGYYYDHCWDCAGSFWGYTEYLSGE